MKKAYVKPMLLLERFEMTQRLSNCSLLIGFGGSASVLKDTDSTIAMRNMAAAGFFTAGNCDWYPEHMDAEDGVCYQTSMNLAFSSYGRGPGPHKIKKELPRPGWAVEALLYVGGLDYYKTTDYSI